MKREFAKIILTGRPAIGKTTVVRKVIQQLDGIAGGFFTREIREAGKRVGFAVKNFQGDEALLAHLSHKGPFRVGKYGVLVEDFERVGVAAVQRAIQKPGIVVVDEVGRMELFSQKFARIVRELFLRQDSLLAVVQQKRNHLIDWITSRKDVQAFTVTEQNRNQLPPLIRRLLTSPTRCEKSAGEKT